ncbi:hypothetical protein EDB87DRAFT_1680408 [Lactarius vividus]|nr:hypothetical protein EDB87DRAFT_1680408 [Lactarius vividus]
MPFGFPRLFRKFGQFILGRTGSADGPKDSDVGRRLSAAADAVAAAQNYLEPFQPLITAAESAIGQTELVEAIEGRIDHFFEGMPIFMNALDVVADLHPFIGVVVMAFKTVYTLEVKRRDNERKIIALYVEMKDMMGVLLLLKDVRNDKVAAPDGRCLSIKDRLESLVEQTAQDIKDCSNVCDTYAKKKLLAKVLLGPVWDNKLLSFVTLFSERREKFHFELSIHTSQGVDKANVKLDNLGDTTRALDKKMDNMMAMFRQLVSPEQRRILEMVDEYGGVKAIRNDDKTLLSLEEMASKAPSAPSSDEHQVAWAGASDASPNADDLKKDIFEDPGVAADRNQVVFFRKFEVQKRQIDELKLVVKRESDRVIEAIKGGPHERILDRSIYEIWAEMGWRGNVKARHFVLAFRDYYFEKLTSEAQGARGVSTTAINTSRDPDAWAIKFIDVTRLQPILEAFDDDASGFITISEMNRFTSSRPEDWSLPHWVAFWAVGYRASIIYYAKKIEELFAKMEGIRADVLPPNRHSINSYLTIGWHFIHTLTAAVTPLQPEPGPSSLDRFKSYLDAEKTRLSTNLKAVYYTIDGMDTLTLITGVGRIEKTVFPLIYLLMQRHYEIMRIMRTKLLNAREIRDCVYSLLYVKDAIRYRVNDLTNIFIQQKHNPETQFQLFAYGIFKYFHNEKDLWSSDYVRTLNPLVIPYNDSNEDQNVKLEAVLKHEYKEALALDDWVYDGHSIDDAPNYPDVEPPLKDILGHWHGYFYENDDIRGASGIEGMTTFVLKPANGEHELTANAWGIRGRYTITGSWSKDENDVKVIKFKMTIQNVIFFSGRFDDERNALTGIWGLSAAAENSCGPIEFRRITPRYLTVYPSIKEISDNKSRALWRFAIAAVRSDIRRERWSWSYFTQRRKDRETVISLGTRYFGFGSPVNNEEVKLYNATAAQLTAGDAHFYGSRINRTLAYAQVHVNAVCDSCNGRIGGARLFCLDCENKRTEIFGPLDLCCAQECMAARITDREDLKVPHEPNHRLLKVRAIVLERQHGRAHTAALAAFERVKTLCVKIAESHQQLEEKDKDGEKTSPDTVNTSSPKPSPEETPSKPDTDKPGVNPDVLGDSAVKVKDLPLCGKCNSHLSFPFWYCIFCEDNLFLCDACEGKGVPDLMRSSGKHTEDHHLIRCLTPEKEDIPSSTEQRLTSLEDRLDNMQSRFDDLSQDLTSRIGNMEQLLHKLTAAVTSESAV